MRVQPINRLETHNKNYSKSKIIPGHAVQNNVNFKSIPSYVIILVAREGIGAIKANKKVKYLNELEKGLEKYYDSETFAECLRALSKTPDAYYDYYHQGWASWVGSWTGKNPNYVDTMRQKALQNFSSLDDKNAQIIQIKKEFMKSFMDNGHEVTESFLENFKNLKDSYYSTLKVDLIDTALFSRTYNSARIKKDYFQPCYPSECNGKFCGQPFRDYNMRGEVDSAEDMKERNRIAMYNNLKLFSVLDRDLYRNFITNRRQVIEGLKNKIQAYFDKELRERCISPGELYEDFTNNLKTI